MESMDHNSININTNAVKAIEVYSFLILFPPDHDVLTLKAFGEDGVIEKEIMKAIAIPIDRICSIEIDPKEIDCR